MNRQSWEILKGKHDGETCFILGAGPSLKDACKLDEFQKIYQYVVISVNSSIIVTPWDRNINGSFYWISNDSAVRNWTYWNKVKKCNAIKIIRDSWGPYDNQIPKDFLVFQPRPSPEHILNIGDPGLVYVSSVPTAMDLAIQMGCKNIYLIGVDHYIVARKSHFWQWLDKKDQPRNIKRMYASIGNQNRIFSQNMKIYGPLNIFAKKCGATIYNCSLKSRVKMYKKIELAKVLQEIKNV